MAKHLLSIEQKCSTVRVLILHAAAKKPGILRGAPKNDAQVKSVPKWIKSQYGPDELQFSFWSDCIF